MKYCIITLNWDSLVVMLSIVCGAMYAISDCLVDILVYQLVTWERRSAQIRNMKLTGEGPGVVTYCNDHHIPPSSNHALAITLGNIYPEIASELKIQHLYQE